MTTQTHIDMEELERRHAADPADTDVLRRLAGQYHSHGIFDTRAIRVYERTLDAFPNDGQATQALNIAHYLQQLRRFTIGTYQSDLLDPEGIQESIDLVRGYLKELGTSPDLFATLGDLCLVKGQTLMAVGAYENALRHGFANLGAIIQSYEFAAGIHPFQPSERVYFANLYRQVGRTDRAIDIFRDAVNEGFEDPTVVTELIVLLDELASHETNENVLNTIAMDVTELHLMLGDVDDALARFATVTMPINQRYGLVKRVAGILAERQDYRGAFDYLSRIPVDDDNKQLLNHIAAELEKIGDLDTAEYLLRFINENDLLIHEARTLRDKEIEIHTELGLADYNASSGHYDFALGNYAKVLRLGFKQDTFVLSRIVELLPLLKLPHTDDFHFVGQYYLNRGDYYRAAQFFDLVLEHRQDDHEARGKLRVIYGAIFDKNPNLPELRLRSGDLYMDDGELQNAIVEYRRAAEFPETNIEATRRLGIAYMMEKQYTEALEAFQLMPVGENDLENLYQLHVVMTEQRRVADAICLLRLIEDVDDTYRDVGERLARLQKELAPSDVPHSSDPQMRELIGDVAVGRYRYMEKIGSGGMGVVHKVFDHKLNRVVAMKILREGLSSSSKAVDRFFREARIAAVLNHPNIVNIYDYNINNLTHQSYISMEFVDGPSLRDLFEEYFLNELPPTEHRVAESLVYLSQVCDALRVTHSKGIIHRDIKPDNILISSAKVAKITDFGIVHVEEATFTPTGALIGTPRYMAPEQVQGTRIDGRADLYSMGIILYEWLTGTPPFVTGDVAYQQVNMPPTPPCNINPDIPPAVNSLVMKCLEKNPAGRFQTARDLKAEMENALRILWPEGTPSTAHGLGHRPGDTDIDTV